MAQIEARGWQIAEHLSVGIFAGFLRHLSLLFLAFTFAFSFGFSLWLLGEGLFGKFRKFVGLLQPNLFQFLGLLGHLCSEIVLLGTVGFQVVEFPGITFSCDEFPVTDADGAVAFMQPPELVAGDGFVLGEGWG